VRFWDTSAIVPMLVEEAATRQVEAVYRADSDQVVWWGTAVECVSALARLEREGALDVAGVAQARVRLDALASGWHEVEPTDAVRRTALRLLRVHALRAADALQVAAAWVAAEGRPETLGMVTFDALLRDASEREGFAVEPRSGST
jgi:uncharacterized protein